MNTPEHGSEGALERLLRESAAPGFRPGFSGRVMARLEANQRAGAEPFAQWTWRLFPRVALAAALLTACLVAWNLKGGEGAWLDRLLSLPACTLDNSLAQLEDVS
jgi:hypothetical protein